MSTVYRTIGNAAGYMFLVIVGLWIGTTTAAAQSTQALEIGETMPLPDRQMKSVSGESISLSEAAGQKGTLVLFWANTCPWVKRYEDRVLRIARNYQPEGIGMIAVNPNDPTAYPDEGIDVMRKRANSQDYPFPYVADSGAELARAFGATRTPQVFLFNAERQLVYKGAIDDNPRSGANVEEAYLRDALTALLNDNAIKNRTTKSFGCTIKW